MASSLNNKEKFTSRLAIEALRNGVPNREAVRRLGCKQPRATDRFVGMLKRADSGADGLHANAQGVLVSGDFGAGKSHFLAHLEHVALSENFVCSKVAVSKETPLYDLGKVFTSAVENGRMPNRSGRLVEELALAMRPRSIEYTNFFQWAERSAADGVLHPIFFATLHLYEESNDFDLKSEIEAFWAGDKIKVASVKGGLKQIGQAGRYKFKAPKVADLPPQRLRFAIELIKSAGYRGWVVLLDEMELIGSYSILQRGRSYAEVAHWMGRIAGDAFPGLIVVRAVTDDFAAEIIGPDGRKKDRDYIRPKLENSAKFGALGARAEIGMSLLERECLSLATLDDDDVRDTLERLRGIYEEAYSRRSPPQPAGRDISAGCGTRSAPPSTNGIWRGCIPTMRRIPRSRRSSPPMTRTSIWNGKRKTMRNRFRFPHASA